MGLSNKQLFVFGACLVTAFAIPALIRIREPSATAAQPQHDSARPWARDISQAAPVEFSRTPPIVALPKPDIDWGKQFAGTSNYFNFVSRAARKAFDGDGRAAVYISKALAICSPIARQYAKSSSPEADFNVYWAGMTKAPQSIVDRARQEFQSCVGFIKGDAFADLPDGPGGYNSSRYWMDLAIADKDPIATSLQAGSDISKITFGKSNDINAKSIESAQLAINNAVTSRDPAALFQVGQLLSDSHASSDPLQGFAVIIAACNLGYDCTANNAEIFHGCAALGECSPGINYLDVMKEAIGADSYAQAYAHAEQLEDSMARGDMGAAQQFLQLKPTL